MEMKAEEIRVHSERYQRVQNLMCLVNEESLLNAHYKQPKGKALGVDRVSKEAYDKDARENIKALIARMKTFSYKPLSVRRTYIPKSNGKLRPLGIPSYEDRIVQSVMAEILINVYEPRFLECSYGFRPQRSAHDVIKFIQNEIYSKPINWVLEADIKGFFDNVDHNWLMKFLENDIQDKNFLRYIKRFLIAGIMENYSVIPSDRGTPQGGLISPVLANVYLHYVLDLWITKVVKPRCTGYVSYVRYADDFLLMFESEEDANKVMTALPNRMAKFGLELAMDKTRILPFGKNNGTKENFDFLGFTFVNARTRKGKYKTAIITSKKKLKDKREAVRLWLRGRLNLDLVETMAILNRKLIGHYNYYGVNGNIKKLTNFYDYVRYLTFKMVNRRSQRKSYTWEKFSKFWSYFITPPSIRVNIWY